MKRISAIALAALAVLFTAGSALAQDYGVQASIPFNFRVGNVWLPAGEYRITTPSSNIIFVRNLLKQNYAAFTMANPTDGDARQTARLEFHRYGSEYFLNQIACGSACSMSAQLPLSKVEKRVMRDQSRLQPRDEVYLALK